MRHPGALIRAWRLIDGSSWDQFESVISQEVRGTDGGGLGEADRMENGGAWGQPRCRSMQYSVTQEGDRDAPAMRHFCDLGKKIDNVHVSLIGPSTDDHLGKAEVVRDGSKDRLHRCRSFCYRCSPRTSGLI